MGSWRLGLPLPHCAWWLDYRFVDLPLFAKPRSTSHNLLCPQWQSPLHITRPTWMHTLRIIHYCTELVFLLLLLWGLLFHALEISSWSNLHPLPSPSCSPFCNCHARSMKLNSSPPPPPTIIRWVLFSNLTSYYPLCIIFPCGTNICSSTLGSEFCRAGSCTLFFFFCALRHL